MTWAQSGHRFSHSNSSKLTLGCFSLALAQLKKRFGFEAKRLRVARKSCCHNFTLQTTNAPGLLTQTCVTLISLNSTPRLRLHDGKLIKDRRYHLRTYPNCFVAQELVDWIVSHKEAPDRATAVSLLQHLMDHDIIHHGNHGPTHRQTQSSIFSEKLCCR